MKISSRLLLVFSIVLILSLIDTGSNYLLSVEVKKNSSFLNKSQEIIRTSGRLHKAMIEMQSSVRGYLLTGDSVFLQSYHSGVKTVPGNLRKQKAFIASNHGQVIILDSIENLHDLWIGYVDSLIKLRANSIFPNSADPAFIDLFERKFKGLYGEKLNERIAEKFREFDRIEYELRARYGSDLLLSIQRTHIYSIIFFLLTIIIGIGGTIYIVSFISRRIKTMVTLADGISKGNFSTIKDESNDELTDLSHSLNMMSTKLSRNISELEKRNAELDKFAYVVSHDLKAPLRGIHNAIKWIREDLGNQLTPEMEQYLAIIPQRTSRMENLINGLLEYARTREQTKEELVDVNEMVAEIVASIVPRDFTVEIANLPVIHTERFKLEQVFTNLLSNAVNHSNNRKPKINISYRENGFYEFSVKDNGIGIEPEYHQKIFEIFQTLREKGDIESTGIGLAIVKKILDDKHCFIRIQSELNKGAEFIFTWPKKNIKP